MDLHATSTEEEGNGGWTLGGPFIEGTQLGEGEGEGLGAAPTFYLYDEIYRLYEPIVRCVQGGEGGGDRSGSAAQWLRAPSEISFYASLADHPWRTMDPCEASIFVVPMLPLAKHAQGEDCAPPDFDREKLHKAAFAVLGRSPYFKRNAGRDHVLFLAEGVPRGGDDMGLRSTLRNVVAVKPSLGYATEVLPSEGSDEEDVDIDWVYVPEMEAAATRNALVERGVKDVELVIMPLKWEEDRVVSMVNTVLSSIPGRNMLIVKVPADATGEPPARRRLTSRDSYGPHGDRKRHPLRSKMAAAVAEATEAGVVAPDNFIESEHPYFIESQLGDALGSAAPEPKKEKPLFPPNLTPQYYVFRKMPSRRHAPDAVKPPAAVSVPKEASLGAHSEAKGVEHASGHTPSAAATAVAKDKAEKEEAIIKATTIPIISQDEQERLDSSKAARHVKAPKETSGETKDTDREARERLAAAAAVEARVTNGAKYRSWGVWGRSPGIGGAAPLAPRKTKQNAGAPSLGHKSPFAAAAAKAVIAADAIFGRGKMPMNEDTREAYRFWDVHFKGKTFTAAEASLSNSVSAGFPEMVTSNAGAAFARGSYCVIVTASTSTRTAAAAASALADAIAAECVPVLVADDYPQTSSGTVRWAEFVILVPHKYWHLDPGTVLETLTNVYGDPRDGASIGSRKLSALRTAMPDFLWLHPQSRVVNNLLATAAQKARSKLGKSGEGPSLACDAKGSANEHRLAALGDAPRLGKGLELPLLGAPRVSSTWARRAGMEKLIGKELHAQTGLPVVRKAKPMAKRRAPTMDPVRHTVSHPEPTLRPLRRAGPYGDFGREGHTVRLSHMEPRLGMGGNRGGSTPSSEAAAFLESLDVGSKGKKSGKMTPPGTPEFEDEPEHTEKLPGNSGNSVSLKDSSADNSFFQLDGGDGTAESVEIGGSIMPPHEDLFSSLAKTSTPREAVPDRELKPVFSEPGRGGSNFMVPGVGGDLTSGGSGSGASDKRGDDGASNSAGKDYSSFSSLFLPSELFKREESSPHIGGGDSGGGGRLIPRRERTPQQVFGSGADASGRTYYPGKGGYGTSESRGRGIGGGDGDDFAQKIADILKTNREEDRKWDLATEVLHSHMSQQGGGDRKVDSRAIARSISNQLKRSLGHLNKNKGADSDEDIALRVAQILRPVLANSNSGGLEDLAVIGSSSGTGTFSTGGSRLGSGLVEININTNAPGPAVTDAAKAELYRHVVGKMGAAGEGGALDPALEKAAQDFVDEMAKSGVLEKPSAAGAASGVAVNVREDGKPVRGAIGPKDVVESALVPGEVSGEMADGAPTKGGLKETGEPDGGEGELRASTSGSSSVAANVEVENEVETLAEAGKREREELMKELLSNDGKSGKKKKSTTVLVMPGFPPSNSEDSASGAETLDVSGKALEPAPLTSADPNGFFPNPNAMFKPLQPSAWPGHTMASQNGMPLKQYSGSTSSQMIRPGALGPSTAGLNAFDTQMHMQQLQQQQQLLQQQRWEMAGSGVGMGGANVGVTDPKAKKPGFMQQLTSALPSWNSFGWGYRGDVAPQGGLQQHTQMPVPQQATQPRLQGTGGEHDPLEQTSDGKKQDGEGEKKRGDKGEDFDFPKAHAEADVAKATKSQEQEEFTDADVEDDEFRAVPLAPGEKRPEEEEMEKEDDEFRAVPLAPGEKRPEDGEEEEPAGPDVAGINAILEIAEANKSKDGPKRKSTSGEGKKASKTKG